MKFHDFSKVEPDKNVPVLVKLKNENRFADVNYYVMVYTEEYCSSVSGKKKSLFVEAGGECYFSVSVDKVEGWMYLSELDNIEVK